jgi:antitoxin VapB
MVEESGGKVESMALNIKDEETYRLVSQLAKRTGESLTLAVKISVKERLERQENVLQQQSRFEGIRRIVEQTAPLMDDGKSSKELMDELYDPETGLPV